MPVYVAGGIPSPCLFGLIRPAIYLTERAAEDKERARQIIAHELTHYRHGDMIWALLRSVCLVVWWFNPLVWLAAALSRQDCELACDEGTIEALGEGACFDYGRTLVGMARVGRGKPSELLCGATTMTTGRKSLKERVARIAQAPKTSATAAVIALVIAAVAVGCTFSGAADTAREPDFTPLQMTVSVLDPYDTEDTRTVVVTDPDEIGAVYDIYTLLRPRAVEPDALEDMRFDAPIYSVEFYPEEDGYQKAGAFRRMQMWETGLFCFYDYDGVVPVEDAESWLYLSEDSERYLLLFEDIMDEYHSESAEAEPVDEVLGTFDRDYWEEVDRELADFAYPADIEVFVSDSFDETITEDVFFGPMTLEDYIYSTDSWQFRYNGEPIANDPFATIKVRDADGRTLWIMDDADALMIEEADGSVTWAKIGADGDDCAALIRRLLPWARGEYVDPADREAELAEQQMIIDELGYHGIPGLEAFYTGAYIYQFVPGSSVQRLPYWAGDRTDVYGKIAYFQYGTDETNIELAYMRFWANWEQMTIMNDVEFQNAKEHFEQDPVYTVTDGLTVNGYGAFAYSSLSFNGSVNTALMWYDTDKELVFRLEDFMIDDENSGVSVPLDEIIALAERVE